MKITFENILEKVVNNKTMSRKEKLNELRKFLKEHSGPKKPTSEKDIELLNTLKALKQEYTAKDNSDKLKDSNQGKNNY